MVGFSDGAVLRLSKTDGTVLEKVYNGDGRYPDVIAKPAEVQGGILISGFEQPSYKEERGDTLESIVWIGSRRDRRSLEGNGTIVYHSGSDGKLRKLDTTTGSVLWEWDSEAGFCTDQSSFV